MSADNVFSDLVQWLDEDEERLTELQNYLNEYTPVDGEAYAWDAARAAYEVLHLDGGWGEFLTTLAV